MTSIDYILSCSDLPFEIGSLDREADLLFRSVPHGLMSDLNLAETHQDQVEAGDRVADWIANNWRTVLPQLSKKFPVRRERREIPEETFDIQELNPMRGCWGKGEY